MKNNKFQEFYKKAAPFKFFSPYDVFNQCCGTRAGEAKILFDESSLKKIYCIVAKYCTMKNNKFQ